MSEHTRAIERDTAHRPWPLPSGPWVMYQSWRHLLFVHWPLPYAALRPLVPKELELEQYDGHAWLGMTPFLLTDLHPRGLPAIPKLSDFPELNLRTYVRAGGRSGIFFFSLDAGSALAVLGARTTYRLPYFTADMSLEERDGWCHFSSRRVSGDAELELRYRGVGEAFQPTPDTLEHFLVERYALFTVPDDGAVMTADIHHPPWTIQPAEAVITRNTVPQSHGIDISGRDPLLHFAHPQHTLIWWPQRVT